MEYDCFSGHTSYVIAGVSGTVKQLHGKKGEIWDYVAFPSQKPRHLGTPGDQLRPRFRPEDWELPPVRLPSAHERKPRDGKHHAAPFVPTNVGVHRSVDSSLKCDG